MTVIAWDGRELAGDKQSTHANMARTPTRTRKVYRVVGSDGEVRLIGCAGNSDDCQNYVRWAKGLVLERPTFTSLHVLCIEERRRVWSAEEKIIWERVRSKFWAIGTGSDIALGAMASGKSAREAVLIASRFSTGCGFGVDVVRF